MLDEGERRAFCILSLFVGGCSPSDFARVAGIADMQEARSWSLAAARYVAALASRSEVEGVLIEPSGSA